MSNKSILTKVFDLFFSMRPILLVPVWGFTIFGYFKAKSEGTLDIVKFWQSISIENYLYFLIFSLSVGAVYVFNQIADIDVDKKNGGLPLIATGIIKVKDAWIYSLILCVLAIGLPFILSISTLSYFAIASISIGILYSFKPTFFSGRIGFDFLSNAIGYGFIAFGVGWWCGGKTLFSMEFIIAAIPYFLLMCSGSINSTLPDINGDKIDGKNTTAVVLGARKAHLLSMFFLVISAVLSIYYKDYLASTCSLLTIPFYIGYIIRPSRLMMEATYKVGGSICMLCACILMPVVLVLSCCIFYCTKIYFKYRHNVNYPSMIPAQYEK